jgi:hypothetical protein
MKNSHLQEILKTFPDDMEILIVYKDNYGERVEDEYAIFKTSINHCNYTTKWQSNIDYYSFDENVCEYVDECDGKKVEGTIEMQKKEVVVMEV